MVSLSIIFVIFGSLLPVMIGAQHSLHVKKERVNAFETLHEAAREWNATGKMQGQRTVNGIFYQWQMSDELCVEYMDYKKHRRQLCIE